MKVVIFQARKGAAERVIGDVKVALRLYRRERVFPCCPSLCTLQCFGIVCAKESLVIGADQIIVFCLGNRVEKALPYIGPKGSSSTTIKPVKFGLAPKKNAA